MKVVINARGSRENLSPEMSAFLDYLIDQTAASDFTRALDREVDNARKHEDWSLKYMTMKLKIAEERDEAFKEGEQQGIQQGRKQGSFQILCGLVHDGLVLASEAAKRLNMSEDEFLKRMNELYALHN